MTSLMRWVRVFAQHLPMRRSSGGESATHRAPLLDTLEPDEREYREAKLWWGEAKRNYEAKMRRGYSDKMMRPERDYADK